MIAPANFNADDDEEQNKEADIIEWCTQIVRTIKDGGIWAIPRSQTVFRVDHKRKQLVLVEAGIDDYADFEATKHWFKKIGWSVVKPHGKDRPQTER